MKIKLLTSLAMGDDGPVFRRGRICDVPGDIDRKLAKRLIKTQQATEVEDEPETAMVSGGPENAMRPSGRARKRR